MNQDLEHLRLLVIFHYVVAGLAALCACLPLVEVGFGALALSASSGISGPENPPTARLAWLLIALGAGLTLLGWTFAACVLAAGRCLAKRRRLLFCQVMAGIECVFMPFGTALGVFSLIVLTRGSVRPLFAPGAAAPLPPATPSPAA